MQSDDSTCQIYALAAAPAANNSGANRLFLAREDGLYHSKDGGQTWDYAYRSLLGEQLLPTLAVALSPDFPKDATLLAGAPGAILVSRDGGETWLVTRLEAPTPLVCGVAFSPDYPHDSTLFAITTDDGVFCSQDGGSTWTNWNFGLLDPNGNCLVVSPNYSQDLALFAGTSTGLFRSRNGGRSWQPLDLPVEDQPITSLAVQARPGGYLLLAGTESSGLLSSPDGGQTWTGAAGELAGQPVDGLCFLPQEKGLAVLVGGELGISPGLGQPFHPWPAKDQPENSEIAAFCCVTGGPPDAKVFAARVDGAIVSLDLK